jgi:hypothetical protein
MDRMQTFDGCRSLKPLRPGFSAFCFPVSAFPSCQRTSATQQENSTLCWERNHYCSCHGLIKIFLEACEHPANVLRFAEIGYSVVHRVVVFEQE